MRVPSAGVRNSGKYTVRKGYIILKYDSGTQVEIPYTRSGSDVTLDILTAFDYNCN